MALEELNVSEDNHLPRPSQPYTPSTTFCEISAPVKNQSDPPVNISSDLTIEINGCRVLIGNSFSKESLVSVIEVLRYVLGCTCRADHYCDVYESISHWDPEKKQARSSRKCIGKVDPDTSEIVPTGKRGRKKTSTASSPDNAADIKLTQQLDKARADITSLKTQNSVLSEKVKQLTRENQQLALATQKIRSLTDNALSQP